MAVSIATNSPAAWLAAIRVKTLTGAMVPVAIALSKTYADGSPIQWVPAVLCLAFALLILILIFRPDGILGKAKVQKV